MRANGRSRATAPEPAARLLGVEAAARHIRVPLDSKHSEKLARMAERGQAQEGALAQVLLANALDQADPDAGQITAILDAIPGAWERTQEGIAQARRGEGAPLAYLAPNRG